MSLKTAILSAAITLLFMLPACAETASYVQSYVDDETGLVFFEAQSGDWGLMTMDGKVLLEPTLADQGLMGYRFTGGYAIVRDKQGLWGMIDTAGTIVAPFRFDVIWGFSEGFAVIRIDDLYGFIDETGAMICDAVYKEASSFHEGYAAVKIGGKYGFLGTSGELAIDAVYGYAGSFEDGLAAVKLDGKYGYVDHAGTVVIPVKYDGATSFQYGLAAVHLDGTALVLDKAGETLLTLPGDGDDISIDIISADEVHAIDEAAERVDYYYRREGGFRLVTEIGSSFDITEYYPNEGAKVAVQDEPAVPPDWKSGAALPKIDGATALFPVYSALVQATYPNSTRYGDLITCAKTDGAYEKLISGEADVIFVAGPSDEQTEAAARAGVAFALTPIGKEAFVFFVSRENPLTEITLDEIRGVYSGKITHWEELGIEDLGDIVAYQRPENSGSQTALETLMEGHTLMEAPSEAVGNFMDDMVLLVEYRNTANAIGYSFRFYVTSLMNSSVTLLDVDGVAPTVENIRSGEYPLITQLYAVTRKGEKNPNVAIFLDWVTSGQGMELVEKAGYVPEK